jgi:L-threonylcarbamoyladenylate synthase
VKLISNLTSDDSKKAAVALTQGNLVVFPTETVYGIGADASNSQAINRIYRIKNRPNSSPLIVHISNIRNLSYWATDVPNYAKTLGDTFWPGPMTLILKRSTGVSDLLTGGQSSVGIRVPSNRIAQDLLLEFENLGGLGIAAPSANRHGEVSATTADAAQEVFGDEGISGDLILNGGSCEYGIESTIINCTDASPSILRPGVITPELIEVYTGITCNPSKNSNGVIAPGMLLKHYAPQTKIVINQLPEKGDGLIAGGDFLTPPGVVRIASPKNLFEYAKTLYQSFEKADSLKVKRLCIYLPDSESGIAEAIKDRVLKAASR